LLLQDGAVDIAAELSMDEMLSIRDSEGVKIMSIPSREVVALGLNHQMEPFTNKAVRQALAHAAPYEKIVNDVYQGQAGMPAGITPSESEWHEVDWPYNHDPDRAKELLEEAGYPDGFEFTLAIQQGIPAMEEIAVNLQDAFRDVGVEMKIEPQAAAIFQEHMVKKEQWAWMRKLYSYVDDVWYDLFLLYETGQVVNWANYSNPRIDELTHIMATVFDADQRRELSREAQEILTEDVALIILAEVNQMIATREGIEGWMIDPDPLVNYWWLYREE
jgi:peptide/nickel transport system substrate-binding protein